ncbi:MAG: divergent polysaccharide deacetylase family protein [Gammaproteobacteria bacterium]|nr:divergent polysaccharide deacetylase family protein [Gammaproteobacteria bacterium]
MVKQLQLTSLVFLAFALAKAPAHAEKLASIIIDDVGNHLEYGQDVIKLPATLTIAILPRTTYAKTLARLAAKNNKEVMLHLPMQSVEHLHHSPGTLDLHMTRKEFNRQLRLNINAVPYIRGVNNHMGSLLTRHPGHMTWLMDELSRHGGLYFIDSKTTNKSIADKIAMEYNVPNLSRDFFLDPDHEESTLRRQFDLFIQKVNRRGFALAIAHPYPKTIAFLKAHLNELAEQGITLIPVSELVRTADQLTKNRGNHHVACTGTACSRL